MFVVPFVVKDKERGKTFQQQRQLLQHQQNNKNNKTIKQTTK
jgi:hypothetical protein